MDVHEEQSRSPTDRLTHDRRARDRLPSAIAGEGDAATNAKLRTRACFLPIAGSDGTGGPRHAYLDPDDSRGAAIRWVALPSVALNSGPPCWASRHVLIANLRALRLISHCS
jgi:hypothetical protein